METGPAAVHVGLRDSDIQQGRLKCFSKEKGIFQGSVRVIFFNSTEKHSACRTDDLFLWPSLNQ